MLNKGRIKNLIDSFGLCNLIVSYVEQLLHKNRVHVIKSIYINVRLLPFAQAIKLPILIYGKTKILSLRGKCIIHAPIKFGMVQFGARNKAISISCDKTYIRIDGNVHFYGKAYLQTGCEFNIMAGELHFGNKAMLTEQVQLVCCSFIKIGNNTQISTRSVLMDNNFHFILNTVRKMVRPCKGKIVIGNNCWIGRNSFVYKNTIIPDNIIVSANSVLKGDYSNTCRYSILSGNPAIEVAKNQRRVFNLKHQILLHHYFRDNVNKEYYILPDTIKEDSFCD